MSNSLLRTKMEIRKSCKVKTLHEKIKTAEVLIIFTVILFLLPEDMLSGRTPKNCIALNIGRKHRR